MVGQCLIPFKQPFVSDEGCFPLVSIVNVNVVVPPTNIKLSKDPGIFYFFNEVQDKGEWVCIFDGVTIDVSIVLAGLEGIGGIFLIKRKDEAWGEFKG